jgi:uncharacterized membrane protein
VDSSEAERLRRLEERVAFLEAAIGSPSGSGAGAPGVASSALAPSPAVPAPSVTQRPPPARPPQAFASPVAPSVVAPAGPGGPLWQPATAAASAAGAAAAPVATTQTRSLQDLEEQLSGRLLAWVGGIALIIGGAFFLSLAFSRGWIGPEARVLIGLIASAAALTAGAWLFERGKGTPALVLAAVGVSVGMLALFAASRLYGLIPPDVALIGSLVVATGAAAIAIRAGSRAVAVLGLLAATLAPPIMGGPVTIVTVVLLGAALVGMSLVASYRPWAWLPALAFVTTSPQLANWLSDQSSEAVALVVIGGYWLVNAIGATGYALRHPRPTLQLDSALHLVGLGLFSIFVIREVLPAEPAAAGFVALMALAGAYALLAGPFVVRAGWREPMAVLLQAIAIGVVVVSVALEMGGIWRPIGWTAIALALAWVAVRFGRRDAGIGAGVVGSLVLIDIVAVIYPFWTIGRLPWAGPAAPFASPEAITVLAIAGAVAVLGWWAFTVHRGHAPARGMPDDLPELVALAGSLGAISLVAYAALFELRGLGVVLVWSAGAVATFALGRLLSRSVRVFTAAYVAGSTLVVLALGEALATIAPPSRLVVNPEVVSSVVPIANEATVGLLGVALAIAVGALLIPTRLWSVETALGPPRVWAVLAGFAVASTVTYLGSIAVVDLFASTVDPANREAARETATQAQVALTIAWVIAGAAAFAAGIVADVAAARVFGLGLLTLATLKLFLVDLAAVEVSYRVLSFIGVGAVLLGSSFLATKRRSRGMASADEGPPASPASTV